jgi:6-phosphogluconate dehydrogenase
MQLGFVGLGKMGGNMVHRIQRDSDHDVVAFDLDRGGARRPRARRGGASLEELVAKLERRGSCGSWSRRATTEQTVDALAELLDRATRSSTAATRSGPTTRRARALRQRHPLRRRRHLGRRLGPRGRLLHDGRRHDEAVERLARSSTCSRRRPTRSTGLAGPLRDRRRRPLREDGPQRRGVRDHAGLRRGLLAHDKPRSSDSTTRRSRTSGCRARSCARGCASSPARVRAGGQRPRALEAYVDDSGEGRWTVEDAIDATCPRRSSPPRCTRASTRAARRLRRGVNAALRAQFGGPRGRERGA